MNKKIKALDLVSRIESEKEIPQKIRFERKDI